MVALSSIVGPLIIFFIVAIAGKTLGIYLPSFFIKINQKKAILLAISMIPRAEVAIIVMDHGYRLGPWAVSQEVYTMMVIIALLTSFTCPLALRPLIKKLYLASRRENKP